MAIINLTSVHDLVQGETAPVSNMANQTGPSFPILGPGVFDKGSVSGVPTKSPLHSNGIAQPGKSVSLLGPAYKYVYGGEAALVNPSSHDLNGQTPKEYLSDLPEGLNPDTIRQ
jgi:hypothetical protein